MASSLNFPLSENVFIVPSFLKDLLTVVESWAEALFFQHVKNVPASGSVVLRREAHRPSNCCSHVEIHTFLSAAFGMFLRCR